MFTDLDGEYAAIEALNNGANFLLKKDDDPRHQFRETGNNGKKSNGTEFHGENSRNNAENYCRYDQFFFRPLFCH